MLTLTTLLLGLFPVVLKSIPGISATVKQIITDVTTSVSEILNSTNVTQPIVNTALSAWAGVIATLQNDPSLPASSLAAIDELEKIVQAVMVQDAALAKSVDWTKINPITPVA